MGHMKSVFERKKINAQAPVFFCTSIKCTSGGNRLLIIIMYIEQKHHAYYTRTYMHKLFNKIKSGSIDKSPSYNNNNCDRCPVRSPSTYHGQL